MKGNPLSLKKNVQNPDLGCLEAAALFAGHYCEFITCREVETELIGAFKRELDRKFAGLREKMGNLTH